VVKGNQPPAGGFFVAPKNLHSFPQKICIRFPKISIKEKPP